MDIDQLSSAFFVYFGIDDPNVKTLYLMKIRKLEEPIAKKRLNDLIENWVPQYGRKYPSIAEILSANVKDSDLQSAWERFRKYAFQQWEPIPDDVYTAKKMIGVSTVNNCTDDDLPRIRKEFDRCYKIIASGEATFQEDPRNSIFVKAGSGYMMLPRGTGRHDGLSHALSSGTGLSPEFKAHKNIPTEFFDREATGEP